MNISRALCVFVVSLSFAVAKKTSVPLSVVEYQLVINFYGNNLMF
jgi:hypothetical protein